MKRRYIVLALIAVIVILVLISYVSGISGTVVDAETGNPIEGAVIHAEWTVSKGLPGMSYTQDYQIREASTNSEGRFRIFGVLNPFVDSPVVVIYKKGYVAWRNDYMFPSYQRRSDVQWKNKGFVELQHFRPTYSHSRHLSFISCGGLTLSSSRLELALAREYSLASKEEKLLREKIKKNKRLQGRDKLWREVIQELYLKKGEIE